MRGVEALKYFFGAVGEPAVAEQESQSAHGQILLVRGHDAVGDKNDAGAVILPAPGLAGGESAQLDGAIALGVGERFVAAVAPAEPAEDADPRSNFLFEVQAKA